MASGILVINTDHQHALERLISTSKRTALEVTKQEFGLMLTNVAKYTPPASESVTGKAAERQGRAKVAGDIRSVYGAPNDAYEAISVESRAAASAFWYLRNNGEEDAAAKIVRQVTGKSLSRFDGGVAHQRANPLRRRRQQRRKEVIFFVSNPQSLESYIQQEESHVWWLASGWAPALRALGRKLPYGVGKLNAPGTFKVVLNDQRIELTAIDQVSFAAQVTGIERRLAWASKIRADALQRRWDEYIQRLGGSSGFTIKKA